MPERERTGAVNWYDKITDVPTYDLEASFSGASMERVEDGSGDFVRSEDYNALLARLRAVERRLKAVYQTRDDMGETIKMLRAELARRPDPAP